MLIIFKSDVLESIMINRKIKKASIYSKDAFLSVSKIIIKLDELNTTVKDIPQ